GHRRTPRDGRCPHHSGICPFSASAHSSYRLARERHLGGAAGRRESSLSGPSLAGARPMRTQVGIVGAGPAGLMLSHLLHLEGIESVILENRGRDYIESRIRAGLIEQWASDLLTETGVGERMQREAMFHNGGYFAFGGSLHYINFRELVGQGVTIYGQQELIKDLVARRLADGGTILFEAADVSVHDFTGNAPKIRFRHGGRGEELVCDFIGGCDGFHGICRPSIPASALTMHDREDPFGWVGILSPSPPPQPELIYPYHGRGLALSPISSPV